VFAFFAYSRYTPCPDCGGAVAREDLEEHCCDRERWLEFQMSQLRGEIVSFESELGEFLRSPEGLFEAWYAEQRRAA
jgi:hypothetical protein